MCDKSHCYIFVSCSQGPPCEQDKLISYNVNGGEQNL